jgi:hypothetical protein
MFLKHKTPFGGICFPLGRRRDGQTGEHGLHAKAAVYIGSQESMYPAKILSATGRAVFSGPQGHYGYQPRFLVGDHDQAAGKSGDILQSSGEGLWNCRFDAVRFLGLGDDFDAQSNHAGRRGASLSCRLRLSI